MAGCLHLFETASAYTEARQNEYDEPWVSLTLETSGVNYNKTEYEKLLETPLTFEITSPGKILWNYPSEQYGAQTKTIEYSKNGGEWTEITAGCTKKVTSGITTDQGDYYVFAGADSDFSGYYKWTGDNGVVYSDYTSDEYMYIGCVVYTRDYSNYYTVTSLSQKYEYGPNIDVSAGDEVRFRGDNLSYYDHDYGESNSFSDSTCGFSVKGNIMSLVNSSGYTDIDTLVSSYTFNRIFFGCTGLTNASDLILPAMSLSNNCYGFMFSGCTSLTTAPQLPATTLSNSCYSNMFNGCERLIAAPKLPSVNLAYSCYGFMFSGCTSLTTAPQLPATTLANRCYISMFSSCTSLTTAPKLPATSLEIGCYYSMFSNCTSLITAPQLPATILASECYQYMFNNCSSLAMPPQLPATTLGSYCYMSMFRGCVNLTSAPQLPAENLANQCYNSMFNGCTSLVTGPDIMATALTQTSACTYMFSGCTSLMYVKCMATNVDADYCTKNWVTGVNTIGGTFIAASGNVNWTVGDNGIPKMWDCPQAEKDYLTFDILEDGEIGYKTSSSAYCAPIEYSKDNGETWTTISATTSGTVIAVSSGDSVSFARYCGSSYISSSTQYFTSTCMFNVRGNIMSLQNKNLFNFLTQVEGRELRSKFAGCDKLISAADLRLPARPSEYGYSSMFYNCTSLTTPPQLPSLLLASNCYWSMFEGCISLTTAPELPSTNPVGGCYYCMFRNCKSLTKAPDLPMTLPNNGYCYENMFYGCENLNYIKCMATRITNEATVNWVYGVQTVSGTFVKNPAMTSWPTGASGIPENWTVIDAT